MLAGLLTQYNADGSVAGIMPIMLPVFDTKREPIQLVDIDMDVCGLRFGVGVCNATGEPCYQTWATCKAQSAFLSITKTYRFAQSNQNLPIGLDAVTLLSSVSVAPQQLTVGKGLGVRASVTVKLIDADWPDHQYDPYFERRGHGNSGAAGTFLGRFRARHRFYVGRLVHLYAGYVGGVYPADYQRRTYVLDSMSGPDKNGVVSLVCKDILKLADDNRAQCPKASTARLAADITITDTVLTLTPTGAGNQFAASGFVRLASEIMSYQRTGDVLTVVRGQRGTTAKTAKADDALQDCAIFTNAPVQDIIYRLLVDYAGVPASYIDKFDWDIERDANLLGVYTSLISDPVGVNALISELSEQGQCYIWWDEVAQKIRFKALVAPPADLPLYTDESHFLADTLSVSELNSERQSRFAVYFDPIDPTKSLTDASNYRQRSIAIDPLSESSLEHGSPRIKTIYSRWFNSGSLGRVDQLCAALLQRYRDPPRQFEFTVDVNTPLNTADLFYASSRLLQLASGARERVIMQVIEQQDVKVGVNRKIKAISYDWTASDLPDRPLILINIDMFNVNLLDLYQSEYGTPQSGQIITFQVADNVLISSASVFNPALDTGLWPDGVTLSLVVIGDVIGRGGNGGYMSNANGINGGNAIKVRSPINVVNSGFIAGGGGGGGASASIYENSREGRVYTTANSAGGGAPFGSGGLAVGYSGPDQEWSGNIFAPPGLPSPAGGDAVGYIGGAGGYRGYGHSVVRAGNGGNIGLNGQAGWVQIYQFDDPRVIVDPAGTGGLAGRAFDDPNGLINLTNNGQILGA